VIGGARLSRLVLGSTDPDRLLDWYRAAFSPAAVVTGEPKVLKLRHSELIFEGRDDVAAGAAEPGRVILSLQVDDFAALEAHLRTLDLTWVREPEVLPFGTIATVADADGNYINLIDLGVDDL